MCYERFLSTREAGWETEINFILIISYWMMMIMEMIMYRLWVRGKSLTQDVAAENIVTTGQRSHLRW